MDGVFLWLAGLLLGISLGIRPREIPWSSPASPWKTLSIPPLLLGLTQYDCFKVKPYFQSYLQIGQFPCLVL